MSAILRRESRNIEPNVGAILRYAGCRQADRQVLDLLQQCLEEAGQCFACRACYAVEPVKIAGSICSIGAISLESCGLAKHLQGCDKAIVMAGTVGVGIDRLIAKYSRVSPAKALMFQAIGTDRIESFCDALCLELSQEMGVSMTYRFSPGYGDLALEAGQNQIFKLLEPSRRIGLTLNDSLLMSPTKSVTAFVGIKG